MMGESMSKKTFNSALRIFIALMLILSIFSGTASAAAGLKITLVDQTPYPAQPGQQIRFWIQAENIGDGTLNNVTVQVVSDGVFSASSSESSKTYDNIYAGTKVYHEYVMYVASDAPDGPRDLTVRYKSNNSSNWIEEKFTVNIGGIVDTDNRGTLIIESVTSSPEVFMPGDEGIIWVTLKNNATNQTISTSNKSVYMTNARIQSADLYSKDNIIVKSEAVNDLGIIAPGDNISIPFRVSIPENTTDGTYLLTLNVTGSSYEYNIKRNVEIKVDSSGIKAIQSKAASMSASGKTMEIDIVNYHQGSVRGVSIVPVAEGMSFYPTEYFIGEMKPDDLYTAKFNISQGVGDSVVEFKAVYYNGDNYHEDSVELDVGPVIKQSSGIGTYIIYLIVILLIAAVVGHFYLKKKRDMSLIDWLKIQKGNAQEKWAARKNKKQKNE
ncbi:hypothetical protein C7391_1074 [Methanimicrococcus blatticola]|uniref:CARDB domain-containing protein n=2 Tax=Methanimicrococcus blatticola TaxID=91560 RepID=A0A484F640_9EURY|nr:hypothetical protein C7391_1074 [Methanimicrococcus blatticola]